MTDIITNPPTESNPLDDTEKTNCRRFLGYPATGLNSSFSMIRFFELYGLMEWRLSNATDSEIVQIRAYLPQLAALETAWFGASANLDTDAAGPWIHNKREQYDRKKLYDSVRREFCAFLGLPPGPALGAANTIRLYN